MIKVAAVVGLALALSVNAASAGEYDVLKDKFSGTSRTVYKSDRKDKGDIGFSLSDYDSTDGTVTLMVVLSKRKSDPSVTAMTYLGAEHHAMQCGGDRNVEIRTTDGTVHSHKFVMTSNGIACGGRIPADWVKGNFAVRVPTTHESLIGEFSTEDLDLAKIAKH
jgi:hypothetical protein